LPGGRDGNQDLIEGDLVSVNGLDAPQDPDPVNGFSLFPGIIIHQTDRDHPDLRIFPHLPENLLGFIPGPDDQETFALLFFIPAGRGEDIG
jgi:hypothetical protein